MFLFNSQSVLHKIEFQEDQSYFYCKTSIANVWECKKWEQDQKHQNITIPSPLKENSLFQKYAYQYFMVLTVFNSSFGTRIIIK